MAVLTCGQGGSNGNQIVTQINENTTGIEANTTAIADLQIAMTELTARVVEVEKVDPASSIRLANNVTQNVPTGEPIPLKCADTVLAENNGFTATILDSVATLTNTSGNFFDNALVSIGMNVEIASSGDELEVYLYSSKDDGVTWLPYSTNPLRLQGAGTGKPVSDYWESDISIEAGEQFQLWGDNGDGSADAVVTYLRTTFRMTAEWNEREAT